MIGGTSNNTQIIFAVHLVTLLVAAVDLNVIHIYFELLCYRYELIENIGRRCGKRKYIFKEFYMRKVIL
ncbi:UNVERIFIED_CONTAM: hypothetical protein NCL1_22808 [Trichonephila clavipes]